MHGAPDSTILHRGFVTVRGAFGPRQVHYRRGGRGPAVLLLHQSPQSSRELEPLIEAWGHAFTLIAPDSPGYGLSEPLQQQGRPVAHASIGEFALALREFADALGIGRFGIYGYHTGASIGTALAEASPDRVTAVAANGLVVLTEDERATILRDYLPPLEPRWDGSHLAWLWARVREQAIFFPWHDRRAATRMDFDLPPAERLQLGLLEFLAAGNHYQVAYEAAFSDRAEGRLPAMPVPLLVTAAARDPLAGHLTRIGPRSARVRVERSRDSGAALDLSFAHLLSHPGDAVPAPVAVGSGAGADDAADHGSNTYLGTPRRQLRVRRRLAPAHGMNRQVILLHAPGSSAAALDALAGDLARHARVLAVDLPGHGGSDPPPASRGPGGTLEEIVTRLAEALAPEVAAHRTSLVAVGASAPIGIELARRLGPGTVTVLLDQPSWSPADRDQWLQAGLPALAPVWYGGHLLEAWHMVRDGRLYSPWFRRESAGIRWGEPDLDERLIQRDVGDLLRANGTWQALLRDLLVYRRRTAGEGPALELREAPADWPEVLFPAAPGRTPSS